MHVELFLLLTGGIILLGFAARMIFEKTRIPDVLLLMGMGMLMGRYIGAEAQWTIVQFAPYFGTLVLIMILFEGGLRIDLHTVFTQLRSAAMLSLCNVLLCTVVIALVLHWCLGWSGWSSALMGMALSCPSSAIILPMSQQVTASEDTRALIGLEAVFSDTFAVVGMLILVELATGHGGLQGGMVHLAASFSVAAAVAFVIGGAWLIVLEFTRHRPLSYLLTFAVLLMLYALVERLKGSGAIAVLVFGLLITEAKRLPKWILLFRPAPARWREEAHEAVQWFHEELTFLVRTFFFVYLGLLFESERLTSGIVLASMVLSGLIIVSRGVVADVLRRHLASHPAWVIRTFLPRGLISAVLAAIPAAKGIQGTGAFLDYVIPVIIITNVVMGMRLFVGEWRAKRAA